MTKQIEPTLRDMHRAARWAVANEVPEPIAGRTESLAFLIASVRADERERCARELEREGNSAGGRGATFGESCIYDVCAAHIRQLPCGADESPSSGDTEPK